MLLFTSHANTVQIAHTNGWVCVNIENRQLDVINDVDQMVAHEKWLKEFILVKYEYSLI